MILFRNSLRHAAVTVGLGAFVLQSAHSYAAKCEYVVQSDWNNGFVASIRITNDTNNAINGWSVNWGYGDGSSRTGGWNANVTGSNPYTATGLNWNSTINPGQTIEFGLQGIKGAGNNAASRPAVNGSICVAETNSSAVSSTPISSSSSSIRHSVIPSSASSRYSTSSYQSTSNPLISSRSSSSRSSYQSTSMPIFSSRSSASSSYISTSISSSSSRMSSSSYSSSVSSSSSSLPLPVAELNIDTHGLTVFVDTRASTDPLGRPLRHDIMFGDNASLAHSHGWHTYNEPGEYEVSVRVHAQGSIFVAEAKQVIQVNASTESNRAPINMLTAARTGSHITAWGSASFDEDGDSLQYIWDFGQGEFVGNSKEYHYECLGGSSASSSPSNSTTSSVSSQSKVVLTVTDGTLADTKTTTRSANCNHNEDISPVPRMNVRVDGLTVKVDARPSLSVTGVVWDFGDGAVSNDLIATHTYATGGEYQIKLTGLGEFFNNSVTLPIPVGSLPSSSSVRSSTPSSQASVQSSSVRSATISSSTPSSAVVPSSSMASSSAQSSIPNHYNAPKASAAPVIDGIAEASWVNASWSPINVFWLGTQPNPTIGDYNGRYKAVWTEDYLYLLFEIVDDQLFDGVSDPLDRYWEDDTVELFIDENRNGGQHSYNTSAWAYHISTLNDVVDYTSSGPKLLNDHIQVARSGSINNTHTWEMRVKIYGEDYADWKTNTPLALYAGKLMGFSAAYIDNDGSAQRESMMGSVDTQGHRNNQGYLDASVFGTLRLVE